MLQTTLIFIGGGLGATARHWAGLAVLRQFGPGFPWGTMGVNVLGSLAMGLLIGWLAKRGGSMDFRLFAATGFLGGFTTFSAFSLDFANLWRQGDMTAAFGYAVASVVLSLLAVFAGLFIMRQV
ncbi:fluoride efflux transporter CrcB [Pseudahrensia aquimaris]|uniref:Fluoride-specific ion channel FluC n=1 Tax=Pseudahrensia aquimaris TaxID=744461 RepID=A0ABW3FIE4_9HYPH